jgi:hypothetical protein
MRLFATTLGVSLALLLGLFLGTGRAGPNANAKILVHLAPPVAKNACTQPEATPGCFQIVVQGSLYPAAYFAHVLVTDGNALAGIGMVQFGIDYDGANLSGVDIYRWQLCGSLEFPGVGWPAPGSGNLVTWDPATRCQRFEPDGPGTGVVATAGYFYLAAYTPDRLAITVRPYDGKASVSACSGEEDILYFPPHLGYAGFGEPGFNPCLINEPPLTCIIQGPSTVVTGTSGNLYWVMGGPDPTIWPPTWTLTGNGTIMSTSGDSVTVSAGGPGTFTLTATTGYDNVVCSRTVDVETFVPVVPTTWSGVKALYREE